MNPNSLFFTADQHFLHYNIIKYTTRPFANVDDMNEELIRNWNDVVPLDGTVFHLGDFALGNPMRCLDIINRLNGTITLIKGNHEKTVMKTKFLRDRFEKIHDMGCEIKVDDDEATYTSAKGQQLIVLSHYAYEVWHNSHYGSWHLHGHSHNNLPTAENRLRLDIGVDNPFCNFYPVSYNKVKEYMKAKKFKPINEEED
jgi:calcineurin-like phosphoesterase family protein